MRKWFLAFTFQVLYITCFADAGTFIVRGDADKYYPVTFFDYGWDNNAVSEVSIIRSSVHLDATWKGSLVAYFKYHVTNWGHQSHFIDANVKSHPDLFIAGWRDMTSSNGTKRIIIWLRVAIPPTIITHRAW